MTASARTRTREELFDDHPSSAGRSTRSELAALTGMSRSTINQSLGRLVADGRVVEVDNETKGAGFAAAAGRLSDCGRCGREQPSPGIDFGHTHVRVGVGDAARHASSAPRRCPSMSTCKPVRRWTGGVSMLETLRHRHDVTELAGVVAGIPGPLDLHDGLVRSPTILSGWVGLAPAEELTRRIGTPVSVENDAVLGALGELHCGARSRLRELPLRQGLARDRCEHRHRRPPVPGSDRAGRRDRPYQPGRAQRTVPVRQPRVPGSRRLGGRRCASRSRTPDRAPTPVAIDLSVESPMRSPRASWTPPGAPWVACSPTCATCSTRPR